MTQDNGFFVRFWGVRGSIPCPGPATAGYGGNTACLEMGCAGRRLLFDAGTGLVAFATALAEAGEAPLDADLFFSHTHHDHVWGWNHFTPLLDPACRLRLWSGHLDPADGPLEAVLERVLAEPDPPVSRERVAARLSWRAFGAGETLEPHPGVTLRTAALNHPNGATGYRVEHAGRSICYLTDTEHVPGTPDEAILGLIEGADLVIYDSTYTDEEFPAHVNWGHSTWQEGVRLCDAADVRTFVVFHHDPGHDDGFMDGVARELEAVRPGSLVAREGMVLTP